MLETILRRPSVAEHDRRVSCLRHLRLLPGADGVPEGWDSTMIRRGALPWLVAGTLLVPIVCDSRDAAAFDSAGATEMRTHTLPLRPPTFPFDPIFDQNFFRPNPAVFDEFNLTGQNPNLRYVIRVLHGPHGKALGSDADPGSLNGLFLCTRATGTIPRN